MKARPLWAVGPECACPPFVKRCTHYAGHTLILVDLRDIPDCTGACRHDLFVVGTLTGTWQACPYREDCTQICAYSEDKREYATESEAELAFIAAELRLIREAS